MATSILSKKSVCIVTGATRGFGRRIAFLLSKRLPPGSLLVLLARNLDLLNEVAALIQQSDGIRAVVAVFDQGTCDQNVFDNIITDCMSRAEVSPESFEQSILIHNAGSLEPLEFIRDLDNIGDISTFFQTNLVGCLALTAKFLQFFKPPLTKPNSRVVINISSLAAVSPMKSWSLYCMAKAARDMMLKVLGGEEENMRALNYAPGPLPTDMAETARKNTKDPDLKNWFEEKFDKKDMVDCDDSVNKLIEVLERNTFENGAHVDYFDEI